jgi:hypothetical protein
VSRGPLLALECTAVDITFSLIILKEGDVNIFLWLSDTRHIKKHVNFQPHSAGFYMLSEWTGGG